jgi:hypothetical protein
VRPVSDLPRGELRRYHYEVESREPRPLDVVRFGFAERLQDPAQPENVLLNDDEWELIGRVSPAQAYVRLEPFFSAGSAILGDTERSIPEDTAAAGIPSSLALVAPDGALSFRVREFDGKKKARVIFDLESGHYDLPLTDPVAKLQVVAAGVGLHDPGDVGFPADGRALLTVSLGEPFDGQRWKLVAALIFVP